MSTSAPETDLAQYYALRAHEYEAVYAKPERQVDIAQIQAWLPGAFEGRDGLELACGTGFWTPFAARRANRWLATDLNDIAEQVKKSQGSVRIVAYAAGSAEEAPVARKLSLGRALQMRAFLIDRGVNPQSIKGIL